MDRAIFFGLHHVQSFDRRQQRRVPPRCSVYGPHLIVSAFGNERWLCGLMRAPVSLHLTSPPQE
jgi:hypothetical protein